MATEDLSNEHWEQAREEYRRQLESAAGRRWTDRDTYNEFVLRSLAEWARNGAKKPAPSQFAY